ncbi:hypothetical protein IFM89_002664 [Coptis chinensis]|uniref:Lipoxygenase n=1 Tax=Coptis chinensis TaxID=261450 RepID=A0A835IJ26_9MAGN|nr:hypothetical protein IFM89_002664 [Coptis chinensis]
MCLQLFLHLVDMIRGKEDKNRLEGEMGMSKKIQGTVVLMRKSMLDFNGFHASFLDSVHELLGKRVSLQLISADTADPENGMEAKLGQPAYLEELNKKLSSTAAGATIFKATFDWNEDIGIPGAFIIKNHHQSEFYLKSVTLEDFPGLGRIHFNCNSWIYPTKKYKYNRVFFPNQTYLPSNTPEPLRKYRAEELAILRGDGTGELKEWDRVYDYALYNDLGDPDKGPDYERPVLGGSSEYPYPRRGRTGRPPTKKDPETEKRLFLLRLDIYVPRDERFKYLKMSDFLAYGLKSVMQVLFSEIIALCDCTPNEFDTFQDVLDLYEGGIPVPRGALKRIREIIPLQMFKEILRSDGERPPKFPTPDVIKEDETAWMSDEEFGRQMLAGVNPVSIRLLQDFPPTSTLDPKLYGNQTSTINEKHIEQKLDGRTVDEALTNNKLFILDHHDALMPYLKKINTTSTKTYATRTLLFLKDDGTLKPLAIELSLPHPKGEQYGAVSTVYTPAEEGVEKSVWKLAKAYTAVNDSGVHQLISHWLNTHAVIEPFVIATNRQLSVLHPIHKLLHPHFRDTMNINALARQILINAYGVLENTVFPAKYSMEMSSVIYKGWVFTEQGLPADLIKRGIAVEDPSHPHGLRLLIEHYPYAVDGLEIWSAIETWVKEYCSSYYPSDEIVQCDPELQSWWAEIRDVGHGDKKNEPWWPKMHTVAELTQSCTIIIWVASALHAAVNFGQYTYAGYVCNRPTISRRFMPEPDTDEYAELELNPDRAFLKTITSQLHTLLGVSLIEILSRHSSDEVYLGQRDPQEWTLDPEPLKAFDRFRNRLVKIENRIKELNEDEQQKNRKGLVNVPYTLLCPNTSEDSTVGGLIGYGIPNSVSI